MGFADGMDLRQCVAADMQGETMIHHSGRTADGLWGLQTNIKGR